MPAYKDNESGKWNVQFYYVDWTGKRKKKHKRGFATKKEAQTYESEFIRKASANMDMKMKSFVEIYFSDKSGELKERSIRNKRYMINSHILPYFGEKAMNEITPSDIINWQNEMRDNFEYSQSYLRMLQNQVTAIFTHAQRIYGLGNNPYPGLVSQESDGLWKEAPALFKAMSLKEGMSKEMIESFLAIMIQSGQFDIILTGTFEAMKKFSNDGEVYCKIINLLYIDREPHKNIELENMLGYAHSTYQLKKEYAIMSFGLMFWKQILDHWDNSTEEMFRIEQELGRDGDLSSRRMQEAMTDSIG